MPLDRTENNIRIVKSGCDFRWMSEVRVHLREKAVTSVDSVLVRIFEMVLSSVFPLFLSLTKMT